jgi:hypothetical protein
LDGPPVAQTCQSPFCGLFAAGPKEITDAPSLPLKAGISPQKTAAALTASFKSLQLWHLAALVRRKLTRTHDPATTLAGVSTPPAATGPCAHIH